MHKHLKTPPKNHPISSKYLLLWICTKRYWVKGHVLHLFGCYGTQKTSVILQVNHISEVFYKKKNKDLSHKPYHVQTFCGFHCTSWRYGCNIIYDREPTVRFSVHFTTRCSFPVAAQLNHNHHSDKHMRIKQYTSFRSVYSAAWKM